MPLKKHDTPLAHTKEEAEELKKDYPNLNMDYVRETVPPGFETNCVAYAVGEDEHYEPASLAKLREFLVFRGYYEVDAGSAGADIDVYGSDKAYVKHVSRKYPDGTPAGVPTDSELWESKLAPGYEAITHLRFDVANSTIGSVIASFKKK